MYCVRHVQCFSERSHVLELVLEGVHEALDVCHRHEYLKEALERQKFDIQVVTHDKSVELNAIVADIEAAHFELSCEPGCQREYMALEEKASLQVECETQLSITEGCLNMTRRKIARADKLEWESLASLYTSACTEDLVELMRAVLLTIDYEPPRFLQSKGKHRWRDLK